MKRSCEAHRVRYVVDHLHHDADRVGQTELEILLVFRHVLNTRQDGGSSLQTPNLNRLDAPEPIPLGRSCPTAPPPENGRRIGG